VIIREDVRGEIGSDLFIEVPLSPCSYNSDREGMVKESPD